jgi:hypothetical protein
MTVVDIIIYDLFHREPNEFVQLIQPYRDVTVAEQLIDSKHQWSYYFNTYSNDTQELVDLLTNITEQVGTLNPQFAANPQKQREAYSLRKFNLAQFLLFLQTGKFKFADLILQVEEFLRSSKRNAEKTYPLDPKYHKMIGHIVDLDVDSCMKVIEENFGDIFDIEKAKEIEGKLLLDEKSLMPPLIVNCVGGAPFNLENHDYLLAADRGGFDEIPVMFRDKYGIVLDAGIDNKNNFVVAVNRDLNALLTKATPDEFAHMCIYYKNYQMFRKINLIKVAYATEKRSLEIVAKKIGKTPVDMQTAYNTAKFEVLDDATWKKIKNTNSYNINNIQQIDKITKSMGRSYRNIVFEMMDLKRTYAPIVIQNKGEYTLVAGNTRLMLFKVLDVTPYVVMINI